MKICTGFLVIATLLHGVATGGLSAVYPVELEPSAFQSRAPDGPIVVKQISYGDKASKDQFPWMVGIFFSGPNAVFCGGVLVAPDAVLTAAHCLEGRDVDTIMETELLVGAYEIDVSNCDCEIRGVKDYYTADYIFSNNLISGDIAVIFLDRPSKKPYARLSTQIPSPDEVARVIGWGYTENSGYAPVSTLRYTDMKILDELECQFDFFDPSSTICTGSYVNGLPEGATSTSCRGDSGGPLVFPGTNEVMGLVSYAVSNTEENLDCGKWERIAYTSIAHYRPWLESVGVDVDIPPYEDPTSTPQPCPSPPPDGTCATKISGKFRLESMACPEKYIGFAKSCSNTDVNLRTLEQAQGSRTHWYFNGTVDTYSNLQTVGRSCKKTILASNRDLSLGSGTVTWQYRISYPTAECDVISLNAKSGQGKDKYLGVRSDCSSFYWRKSAGRLSTWRLVNVS